MSFIRPEIRRALAERAEVIVFVAGVAAGLWITFSGLSRGSLLLDGFGAALALICAGFALAALRRRGFLRPSDAPGLVQVDEARIGYFGPGGGAFIDRDALTAVTLLLDGRGSGRWLLAQHGGPPLLIPLAARGAETLIDLYTSLPGAALGPALEALKARAGGEITVWRAAQSTLDVPRASD